MTTDETRRAWLDGQRICVTGGGGLIGRALTEYLLAGGVRVVAVTRSAPSMARPGVEYVSGDVRDGQLMARAMKQCSAVVHLAARHSPGPMASALTDTNVGGSRTVAEAAVDEGVPAIVLASSGHVYGRLVAVPVVEAHPLDPISEYGRSKRDAELAWSHATSGGQTIPLVARLANVYSPTSGEDTVIGRALAACIAGREVRLRRLGVVRDFIHVDDVVTAIVDLLRTSATLAPADRVVNVSSGVGTSIRRVAEMLLEAATAAGVACGPLVEEATDGEEVVPTMVLDHRRLHAATGWSPMVSLPSGLRRAVNARITKGQ